MTFAEFLDTPEGKIVTRTEWARRLGVARSYISLMASGAKVPSAEVMYRIQKATNDAVQLVDWVEPGEGKDIGGVRDSGIRGSDTEVV